MKFTYINEEFVTPPGTLVEILAHPIYQQSQSIELALFAEHRYSFFFWNKWTRKLIAGDIINHVPALITLDWHQDLVYPTTEEKRWLRTLDVSSNKNVSLYAWGNLRPLNDTHVLSAAYLNLIGNIYIHCRQGDFEDDWKDEYIKDRFGNIHTIRKFKNYDDLEAHLLSSREHHAYFDIDLDFFTIDNPLNGAGKDFTYLKNAEIVQMLQLERPLIKWLFQRICGITIATEPEHTGGLFHSNKLLEVINNIYFKPSLFTNYGENWRKSCTWKHLPRE